LSFFFRVDKKVVDDYLNRSSGEQAARRDFCKIPSESDFDILSSSDHATCTLQLLAVASQLHRQGRAAMGREYRYGACPKL
jgi:hypothetical protein